MDVVVIDDRIGRDRNPLVMPNDHACFKATTEQSGSDRARRRSDYDLRVTWVELSRLFQCGERTEDPGESEHATGAEHDCPARFGGWTHDNGSREVRDGRRVAPLRRRCPRF